MSRLPSTPGQARALLAALWRAGRGPAIGTLGLSVALGLAEAAGILLLLPVLERIGLGTGVALPVPGSTLPLSLVLGVFVALVAASALLARAHERASARLAVGTVLDLRRRLHGALGASSWPWFSRVRAADAAHALGAEADRAGAAARALLCAGGDLVLALVYAGLVLAVAPGLAALAALLGGLGLLAWFRVREARWWGTSLSGAGRDLNAVLGEGMLEARTDRAEGRVGEAVERFGAAAGAEARAVLTLHDHFAGSRALVTIGTAAVLAAFVAVSVDVLGVPAGALVLSLFLLNRLLHRSVAVVQQVESAAADLPGFGTVERMTRAALAAAEVRGGAGSPSPVRGEIVLEGVSFSYGGPDRRPAVEDATFRIAAGSLAVLAGPSGSGKTTLADLVAGVLAPDRGRILVDGAPTGPSFGETIGYAGQDALLLHGTVRSNLLRARPGAGEEEVRAALARAGAPDPSVDVGERGQALSEGERRRVLLARALLRSPSLLVLDGIADGLDPASEAAILDVLDGLRGRATVILVSHGEEASRRADLVVRMERGRARPALRERAP